MSEIGLSDDQIILLRRMRSINRAIHQAGGKLMFAGVEVPLPDLNALIKAGKVELAETPPGEPLKWIAKWGDR